MADSTDVVTSDNGTTNLKESVAEAFMNMVEQFMTALSEVWEEDCMLIAYNALFKTTYKDLQSQSGKNKKAKDSILLYHKQMAPYYSMCLKKNAKILKVKSLTLIKDLGLRSKYNEPGLDQDTKDCMWEYVIKLNELANMYNIYNKIPDSMLSTVQSISSRLTENEDVVSEDGQVNLRNLDFNGLMQDVMGSFNEGDMQQLASSMMEGNGIGNLTSMYQMLGNMLGPK